MCDQVYPYFQLVQLLLIQTLKKNILILDIINLFDGLLGQE